MSIERTSKPTLLFVDDSRLVRFAAKKSLGEAYRLLLAENGEDALRQLSEHPDIRGLVTDLMMPELDGFGLIEALRNHEAPALRALPVMVVSGSAGPAERKRLHGLGVDALMTKPFRDDALRLRVARLLDADEVETAAPDAPMPATGARQISAPVASNVEARRASFIGRLRQALALHLRHKLPLTILQVRLANGADLDREYGKGGARTAMRLVEYLILKAVRVEDTVGRTGPDQRTLLLPATSVAGARALRTRLRDAIASHSCTIGGRRPHIELEFYVLTPKPNLDARVLMKTAPSEKPGDNIVSLSAREAG